MATNSYWKYIKKRQAEAGNIQQSPVALIFFTRSDFTK